MEEESSSGIRVSGMQFAYDAQPPLFLDFSLSILPGSRCLLVGANGSGNQNHIFIANDLFFFLDCIKYLCFVFSVSQLRDYVLCDCVHIVCNYPRIGSIYFVGIQVIIVASMIFLFQMYGCQFGRDWLRAYCWKTENEPEFQLRTREREREREGTIEFAFPCHLICFLVFIYCFCS